MSGRQRKKNQDLRFSGALEAMTTLLQVLMVDRRLGVQSLVTEVIACIVALQQMSSFWQLALAAGFRCGWMEVWSAKRTR